MTGFAILRMVPAVPDGQARAPKGGLLRGDEGLRECDCTAIGGLVLNVEQRAFAAVGSATSYHCQGVEGWVGPMGLAGGPLRVGCADLAVAVGAARGGPVHAFGYLAVGSGVSPSTSDGFPLGGHLEHASPPWQLLHHGVGFPTAVAPGRQSLRVVGTRLAVCGTIRLAAQGVAQHGPPDGFAERSCRGHNGVAADGTNLHLCGRGHRR